MQKGDVICRQAAIDEITEYGDSDIVYMSAGELKRRLEQLPPAQSEIIRCKDCKHRPTGTDRDDLEFPDDKCPCKCEDYWYSWKPADDWFCGNGE